MQADWEFELGEDAPVIDAAWAGFLDLRSATERVRDLPEAAELPALAEVLIRLNAPLAPVWTSKCDVWSIESLEAVNFGRFDLDATEEQISCAVASYIDLLPRSDQQWQLPARVAAACDAVCQRLQPVELRCCRADLVIRQAYVAPGEAVLGFTAYLIACGATEQDAHATLSAALHAFTDAVLNSPTPAETA